eukprot:gene8452-277_t
MCGYYKNLEIERQNLVNDMMQVIALFDVTLIIVKDNSKEALTETAKILTLNEMTLKSLTDEQKFKQECEEDPNHLNDMKELVSGLLIECKTHLKKLLQV